MTATTEVRSTLDLAQVTPGRHAAALLSAFDQLSADERFVLVVPYDPHPLLATLQIERWGRFEWSPLVEGPGTWRVEVGRRAAGQRHRVATAMEWDHHRLEQLESAVFEARESGRLDTARVLGRWLAHGLRRHIRFEDELLFPEWEARGAGRDAALLRELREEHAAIARLVTHLEEQIADPEAPVELVRRALRHRMREHERKEVGVLAALDAVLDPDEAEELVARVQAWGPS